LKGMYQTVPGADLNRVRKDAIDHMFDRLLQLQSHPGRVDQSYSTRLRAPQARDDQHLKLVVSHRNNLAIGVHLHISAILPEVTPAGYTTQLLKRECPGCTVNFNQA